MAEPNFKDEFTELMEMQKTIMAAATECGTPTAMAIARQTLDHLMTTALFLQHLDSYLINLPQMQEEAVADAQKGNKLVLA